MKLKMVEDMDWLESKIVIMFGVKWIVFCVLLLTLTNCNNPNTSKVPYFDEPSFEALWLIDNSVKIDSLHQISAFSFPAHNKELIGKNDIKGKVHVANFFFTACPSVCPKMMANLKLVQSNFRENESFKILSFSVTPWIDSIPRLNEYALTNGIEAKNWHLLTGNKKEIYSLARKSYFAEEEPGFAKDSSGFLHTEHFVLVDKNFHIRGLYNGTNALETERLIDDIEILLK